MSQDVVMVESVDQAAVMMKPLRIAMLRELGETRTCQQLAATFDLTPQKVYYHVKTMEKAGLVTREGERLVNGIADGFSPSLVRHLGGRRSVQDQGSLGILAGHAEEMLEDVAHLAGRSATGEHIPSLSLGVEVELPDGDRRSEFLEELRTTFEDLARRYAVQNVGVTHAQNTFRFTLACYPKHDMEAA
jgi:DNA-binding transcriptional ArsR family regulator